MKKSLLSLAVVSALAMLFLGCPQQPEKPIEEDTTLTGQIAAAGSIKDFENAVIAEDAEVNKALTISNLDMDGKTLTVKVSGVTLKNLKNANVIADAGIGDGDLIIEGSQIGKLQVLGGGANSIHIKDTTTETVSVEKADVRVALEGETTVSKVILAAENAKIEADDEVTVGTLQVKPEATGFDVAVTNISSIDAEGVEAEALAAGISLPSEAEFFKAAPCAGGIKITLKETTEYTHYTGNLGTISVNGSIVHINITGDGKGSYLKEYVFPFVEKDKEYIVTFGGAMQDTSNSRKYPWFTQSVKVKAGGGQDLSKYITEEQLALYDTIKPVIEVHENVSESYYRNPVKETTFTWGFDADITDVSQLCNVSELADVSSGSAMVLGYIYWLDNSG